ncbi:MAG: GNAT family N-acetyltransferase [Bacilli bacterium]|nr:GNAT family N-acetyltransferase [Bacilli bacterium]
MIKIKENNKDVNEFNYLYEEVGWGAYSYECSKKALDNTLYSISIYDEDKVIGFGRLIGDGICFIYIHDVMVVPSFQSQGIGSMIMNKLLEKVKEIKTENPSVRTYLGASAGKEGFYEKFGFVKREEAGLGSGMILQNKDDFI